MQHPEKKPPVSRPELEHPQEGEILDPRHFYAAYIYENAQDYQQDITSVVTFAQQFKYPVRYWWLSEAINIGGHPDRLIVCVHHAVQGENAGLDLYNALQELDTKWDALESASIEEYAIFGKPIKNSHDILQPDDSQLFPNPILESQLHETRTLLSIPDHLFNMLTPAEQEAFNSYLSITKHVLSGLLEEKETFDKAGMGLIQVFDLISEHMRVVSQAISLLTQGDMSHHNDDIELPF